MRKRLLALAMSLWLLLSGCVIVIEVPYYEAPEVIPELSVHYLDVGQADCALVECDGKYMLIDGGNREDSRLVVAYLQEQNVQTLEAVVCTHAHEDHVGGLSGVLAVFPTEAVYAPTDTYSSATFDSFLNYTRQQGLSVTIPQPGDSFFLGSAVVTVLGPVKIYPEPNNTSLVLRITYGETAFLFTGDMEQEAEIDMLEYWGDRVDWETDVLKVAHHCSESSTCYRFLYRTMPDYGIISVGTDNTYGHPHKEPMARLDQAGVTVFRTDLLGTVLAVTDGQTVRLTWENQRQCPVNVQRGEDFVFIGNKNSHIFHHPDCAGLPDRKNRVEFMTYEEALEAGFTPCGSCFQHSGGNY